MRALEGKVAIVTGASRGIGRGVAELFCREGARVVCAARTLEEGTHPLPGSLETTLDAIRAAGGDAAAVACDVSDYEQCARLVEQTRRSYGPVEILVNNAALTYFLPIREFPVKKWLRSTGVNFHGPFYLSQLVLNDMISRGSGSIVNLSSPAAVGPGRGPYEKRRWHGSTLYGAEKAALERFTQGLAEEVYEHGISVTCLSPSGAVPTPGVLYHELIEDENDPRAEPMEVFTEAVLLLVTEPLDAVTGRVCYSQELLLEFGRLERARGFGVDFAGTGYSRI